MSEDDPDVEGAFLALDPSPARVARMRDAVLRAHAPLPSLSAEWMSLLEARPVANTLFTFAAAAVLILGAILSTLPWAALSDL